MRVCRLLMAVLLASAAAESAVAVNIVQGQQIYNMHCAACHGPRGEGVMPEAPKFRMGERLDQPDMVLLQSVKSGKKAMPPFFGILQDSQILDVLAFVRTLR